MSLTSDLGVISPDELLQSFGTSAPGGNKRINSTKTERGVMQTLYTKGDAYIYGCVKTPLRICKSIHLPDGSAQEPGLTFENDQDTGFYYVSPGKVGMTSNGTNQLVMGLNALQVNVPITTATGNLVINPAGTNVDFTGHNIINAGPMTIVVGSPNHVIINDGAGNLTSEAQLSTTRGGTGIDSSAETGVAKVNAGTWSVSPITDGDFGTITNLSVGQLTATTIAPTAGDLTFSDNAILHHIPIGLSGGDTMTHVANVATTDNTPTILLNLPTVSGPAGRVYSIRGLVSLGDATGGADTGMYTFSLKGKNLLGVVTVSTLIQKGQICDGTLTNTDVTADVGGTNIRVLVTGLNATTINWIGRFDITAQEF